MTPQKVPGKTWVNLGAAILAIVSAVFAVEGGFSDNPADPGGATNHGVTEKVARENGYSGDMRELPREFAEQVYTQGYIEKPGFDRVIASSPALGHKLVDAGVNTGQARAARWLQEALNQLSRGGRDYPRVAVDGQVGPQTLQAYQALERKRGRVKACELVIKLLDVQQGAHYMRLGMSEFMVGWADHRLGNVPLSRCAETVAGGGT